MSQKMIEIRLQIDQIDDRIETLGGFHCGWKPSDHEDFLRIKTKHKHKTDKLSFLNEILGLIPDSDIGKIKEHIKTHKEYLELTKEKKELLQKYKKEKIVNRNTKLHGIESSAPKFQENDRSLLNRSQSSGRSVNQFSQEYRDKQKQKILEWKQKKAEEEKSKKTQSDLKKKETLEKKKEREREELEWKQHKVKQYQLQKELKEQQKKEISKLERIKKRHKYEQDYETRQRIYRREEEHFRKRAELVISKKGIPNSYTEEEQALRMKRAKLLQKDDKYANVESRLNKVTKAAQGKNREKFKEGVDDRKDAMTFGGQLRGPTVRAQPAWRKGL
ncbi:unnamed protein product [Moneuplotes crassus]|uniref:Uncharacterized protein n=1 Tax=Euplotes crassus TaxID=5936 RepID=A0AAD1UDX9_EUPCR|nr:unnamed protein product [Moneuplotes crassus]